MAKWPTLMLNVDTVKMDQHCIVHVCRCVWHWIIVTFLVTCHNIPDIVTLNDLHCSSAMSIWYKHNIHTHTLCPGWVLATLFPVLIFPFHAISTECNFLQLSPPQQQFPRGLCGTEVCRVYVSRGECSAVMPAWHWARTSIFLLSISSLRVSPVAMHQQLLIRPGPGRRH